MPRAVLSVLLLLSVAAVPTVAPAGTSVDPDAATQTRVHAGPSPLAALLWRWHVRRLLHAGAPVALSAPEPESAGLRVASRIGPLVRARLAARAAGEGADGRMVAAAAPVGPDAAEPAPRARSAGRTAAPAGPAGPSRPSRGPGTLRLASLPLLATAPAPATPALVLPSEASAPSSALLHAAAALAHGRIETGDDTWKLGITVSRDLDEFGVRLRYAFPTQ